MIARLEKYVEKCCTSVVKSHHHTLNLPWMLRQRQKLRRISRKVGVRVLGIVLMPADFRNMMAEVGE